MWLESAIKRDWYLWQTVYQRYYQFIGIATHKLCEQFKDVY